MQDKNNSNKATTAKAPKIQTIILTLSAMLSATYGRRISNKAAAYRIRLEKAGILRTVAERIETKRPLTDAAYKKFKKISQGTGSNAADALKIITLANSIRENSILISKRKKEENNAERILLRDATTNLVDETAEILAFQIDPDMEAGLYEEEDTVAA